MSSAKLDKYSLKARIAPAIFTVVVPVLIFSHFYVAEEFSKILNNILVARILSNISIATASLYFLAQFGRLIGKNVFEKFYFGDEKRMPTTNLMLFRDQTYSDDFKTKVRARVKSDFDTEWSTKDQELQNENLARTKIVETMALIRKKLHDNQFLLQHNIEYGAMRNAIGGSVLGALFSSCNILFFKTIVENNSAVKVSIFTLVIYLLLILLSRPIMAFYGANYAKILFREYMGELR